MSPRASPISGPDTSGAFLVLRRTLANKMRHGALPRRSLGIYYQSAVIEHHARAPATPLPLPLMTLPAVSAGWPETMRREFFACRGERDRHAWAEKWARILDGSAHRDAMAIERLHAERRGPRIGNG